MGQGLCQLSFLTLGAQAPEIYLNPSSSHAYTFLGVYKSVSKVCLSSMPRKVCFRYNILKVDVF